MVIIATLVVGLVWSLGLSPARSCICCASLVFARGGFSFFCLIAFSAVLLASGCYLGFIFLFSLFFFFLDVLGFGFFFFQLRLSCVVLFVFVVPIGGRLAVLVFFFVCF